jgi:Uma2 family endonuclease
MTTTPAEAATAAEILDELGGIPASRLIMTPPPGQATEADVLRLLGAPRKRICELIDGTLVEKAMGFKESVLGSFLNEKLNGFVRPRNLGLVTMADGTLRLWAGRVRIPDVSFTSWDRIPGRKLPPQPIPELCPDLTVEVLSETNTLKEMDLKRKDDFTAGVRLHWEIDPDDRTAAVYTGVDDVTDLTAADTLVGDSVLPGFTLPLAELFAELDRQG